MTRHDSDTRTQTQRRMCAGTVCVRERFDMRLGGWIGVLCVLGVRELMRRRGCDTYVNICPVSLGVMDGDGGDGWMG